MKALLLLVFIIAITSVNCVPKNFNNKNKGVIYVDSAKHVTTKTCEGLRGQELVGTVKIMDKAGFGIPCGTDVGVCTVGVYMCHQGKLQCMGGVRPSKEICDGKDNDCNGEIDDGIKC